MRTGESTHAIVEEVAGAEMMDTGAKCGNVGGYIAAGNQWNPGEDRTDGDEPAFNLIAGVDKDGSCHNGTQMPRCVAWLINKL